LSICMHLRIQTDKWRRVHPLSLNIATFKCVDLLSPHMKSSTLLEEKISMTLP